MSKNEPNRDSSEDIWGSTLNFTDENVNKQLLNSAEIAQKVRLMNKQAIAREKRETAGKQEASSSASMGQGDENVSKQLLDSAEMAQKVRLRNKQAIFARKETAERERLQQEGSASGKEDKGKASR